MRNPQVHDLGERVPLAATGLLASRPSGQLTQTSPADVRPLEWKAQCHSTNGPERQLLAPRVQTTFGQSEIQLDSTARRPSSVPTRAIHRAFASGVLPAALLVSVALGGTTAAAAPGVTCGSTVTTDVTLTADLHCPSGDGIILGSNVTLDLGGHSLVGGGSGVGVQTELSLPGRQHHSQRHDRELGNRNPSAGTEPGAACRTPFPTSSF